MSLTRIIFSLNKIAFNVFTDIDCALYLEQLLKL